MKRTDNWKKSEACKEYHRQRYLKIKDDPEYKKRCLLNNWTTRGLITNDIEAVYKIYINTTHCDKCKIELTNDKLPTPTRRSMDHSHETGEFRYVLCNKCNVSSLDDVKCSISNKLGIKNITYEIDKGKGRYTFCKTINKKIHKKRFKTLQEAIDYKTEYLKTI